MMGKARRYLQDMRGRRPQANRGTSWQKASSSKTQRAPYIDGEMEIADINMMVAERNAKLFGLQRG